MNTVLRRLQIPAQLRYERRIFADLIPDLRLNGHPIPQSATDGYLTWIAKGMTIVQINVPPEKSKVTELYTITCEYDPGEQRGHWRGW